MNLGTGRVYRWSGPSFPPLFVLTSQISLLFCTLSHTLVIFRRTFKSLSGRKIQMKDWFALQMWPQYPGLPFMTDLQFCRNQM